MKLSPAAIPDVLVIETTIARDARGSFDRVFDVAVLAGHGVTFALVQISRSVNVMAHTLRGLHYQRAPHAEGKIIRALRGRAWDVGLDLRPASPTHGRWCAVELCAEVGRAVYLPPGFAHGFLTLEPDTELLYLTDHPWTPGAEAGVRWDDPAYGIAWPHPPAVLSDRDRAHPLAPHPHP